MGHKNSKILWSEWGQDYFQSFTQRGRRPYSWYKKRLIKHTHIGSYKSTYTITQDKYIHTQLHSQCSCFRAQCHTHPWSFTSTLINNQTHRLRYHRGEIHKYILTQKYKKLHWKTSIQGPYKHTNHHHHPRIHTEAQWCARITSKMQTHPIHGHTVGWTHTHTHTRDRHTRAAGALRHGQAQMHIRTCA